MNVRNFVSSGCGAIDLVMAIEEYGAGAVPIAIRLHTDSGPLAMHTG
jgi:hypothetical protein